MGKYLIVLCFSLCTLCLLCTPATALAQDNCDNLTSNPEWNQGIREVSQLIQSNRYDEARSRARELSRICAHTAVLNYMQGKIASELGQKADALLFYQKASEATYIYAVDPDMANKIWYARYENEHPERTAKSLEERDKQTELRLNENTSDLLSQFQEEQKQRNYKMMWTGIGLGIGGVVLLGTGIGLWGSGYSKDMLDKDHHYVLMGYKMSLSLMGVGSALTLTGGILAGLFGYWYKQSNQTYSFDISLTGAAFRMVF